MNKKEKSCGAVVYRIINNTIYYCLIQKLFHDWGFPKGHVEGQESEEETALREIKEETNLDVIIDTSFREIDTYYVSIKQCFKDVVYFVGLATSNDPIPQETEVLQVKWVTFLEAKKFLLVGNDYKILSSANEYITNKCLK